MSFGQLEHDNLYVFPSFTRLVNGQLTITSYITELFDGEFVYEFRLSSHLNELHKKRNDGKTELANIYLFDELVSYGVFQGLIHENLMKLSGIFNTPSSSDFKVSFGSREACDTFIKRANEHFHKKFLRLLEPISSEPKIKPKQRFPYRLNGIKIKFSQPDLNDFLKQFLRDLDIDLELKDDWLDRYTLVKAANKIGKNEPWAGNLLTYINEFGTKNYSFEEQMTKFSEKYDL